MTDYKTNTIKAIRAHLEQNLPHCVQAMTIIHSYQVQDEFDSGNVYYANNMGSTPADAKFLTSLCNRVSQGKDLSEKQLVWVQKLMPKYARQLFDHFLSAGRVRRTNTSKFICNVEALFEKFESSCPETAQPELPFDDEDEAADRAYAQEAWRETMADDYNYFNFERYLSEVSSF